MFLSVRSRHLTLTEIDRIRQAFGDSLPQTYKLVLCDRRITRRTRCEVNKTLRDSLN
ncbi:hypothetical protein CKA32_002899 [Geitlerinema sp. FC II]|nr:hypothetical protein CKA32_002899 [Geitlerinema sp. FC II]